MHAYIDLHIHSALSPCADNEMTPNNIVNMAWLKGLDVIAVTDHNSVENCRAVMKCAQERGILVIPGMEVETREEVHVVCLFPDMGSAIEMQSVIWSGLPDIKNRVDIFGEQLKMDDQDNIIGKIDRLLVTASDIGVDDVFEIVEGLGGVALPAHIDRASYSLLSNLGFIPEELRIRYLELSKKCDLQNFLEQNKGFGKYRYIKSSDAHILGDILEKEFCLEVKSLSIEDLFKVLKA